jgi:hypothetical protein
MAGETSNEIDVAGALAALEEQYGPEGSPATAGQLRDDRGRFANTQREEESTTPGVEDAPEETEEATTPVAETAEEEVSFTHIPDEALTPELLAVKRAMQADYTRKMQEVAPLRKAVEEFEFQSPDDLREALSAYRTISDPSNWPKLHAELSTYLQTQGLSPAVADAAAARTLGESTSALSDEDVFVDDEGDGADSYDPRILSELEQVKRSNAELRQLIEQDRMQRRQEAELLQRARVLTDQENEIRQTHRDWDDQDWEVVYDLLGDSGDLHAAAARYETILGRQASRYLTSKESALRAPTPVPGDGVISTPTEEPPHTLEEAHERAMAYARQRDMQDAQS